MYDTVIAKYGYKHAIDRLTRRNRRKFIYGSQQFFLS